MLSSLFHGLIGLGLAAWLVLPCADGKSVTHGQADAQMNPWKNAKASRKGIVDGEPCTMGTAGTLGECNMHCVCHKKKWRCCRVRKEFTQMTQEEIDLFVSTLYEIRKHNKTEEMFRYVVDGHITNAPFVHTWPFFLPWHRMWFYLFEETLREIDCRVTVPYFDFTQNWRDWYAHSPFDEQHLGGDGHGDQCCVTSGPFREGLWNVTQFVGGGCLRRTFNKMKLMPSPRIATLALAFWKPEQVHLVSDFINFYFHDKLHDGMGGFMMLASASVDPAFWMLHAYLDKMWASWQERGPLFKKAAFAAMTDKILPGSPPTANYTPADFFDTLNQAKKNVRVCYSEQMSDTRAIGEGMFTAPSVPRRKAVRNFSAGESTRILQSLTKLELQQLSYMLGLGLKATSRTYMAEPTDCVWKNTPEGIRTKITSARGLRLGGDRAR